MPPLEPVRDFLETILRQYIVANLPSYPTSPNGWTHKPRGCGKYKYCDEMDDYLRSSTEEIWSPIKGPRLCQHLEQQLHSCIRQGFFHWKTELQEPSRGKFASSTPSRISLTKLGQESQAELEEYGKQSAAFEQKVAPLRGAYTERLLGQKLYSELILLDQLARVLTKGDGTRGAEEAALEVGHPRKRAR
jgi:hypothetical protein